MPKAKKAAKATPVAPHRTTRTTRASSREPAPVAPPPSRRSTRKNSTEPLLASEDPEKALRKSRRTPDVQPAVLVSIEKRELQNGNSGEQVANKAQNEQKHEEQVAAAELEAAQPTTEDIVGSIAQGTNATTPPNTQTVEIIREASIAEQIIPEEPVAEAQAETISDQDIQAQIAASVQDEDLDDTMHDAPSLPATPGPEITNTPQINSGYTESHLSSSQLPATLPYGTPCPIISHSPVPTLSDKVYATATRHASPYVPFQHLPMIIEEASTLSSPVASAQPPNKEAEPTDKANKAPLLQGEASHLHHIIATDLIHTQAVHLHNGVRGELCMVNYPITTNPELASGDGPDAWKFTSIADQFRLLRTALAKEGALNTKIDVFLHDAIDHHDHIANEHKMAIEAKAAQLPSSRSGGRLNLQHYITPADAPIGPSLSVFHDRSQPEVRTPGWFDSAKSAVSGIFGRGSQTQPVQRVAPVPQFTSPATPKTQDRPVATPTGRFGRLFGRFGRSEQTPTKSTTEPATVQKTPEPSFTSTSPAPIKPITAVSAPVVASAAKPVTTSTTAPLEEASTPNSTTTPATKSKSDYYALKWTIRRRQKHRQDWAAFQERKELREKGLLPQAISTSEKAKNDQAIADHLHLRKWRLSRNLPVSPEPAENHSTTGLKRPSEDSDSPNKRAKTSSIRKSSPGRTFSCDFSDSGSESDEPPSPIQPQITPYIHKYAPKVASNLRHAAKPNQAITPPPDSPPNYAIPDSAIDDILRLGVSTYQCPLPESWRGQPNAEHAKPLVDILMAHLESNH